MPKAPPETLEDFLQRQPAPALAQVLLELSASHDAVRQRLARMQLADSPAKLAASFKKTLSAWRRSTKYYGYRESGEFARELEAWLEQVARELAPRDPPAAVALFETFIQNDVAWFERADDSDGAIGDAVRTACCCWLEAAARCETPAHVWIDRLVELAGADEYGAREELWRRADLLLAPSELRGLVDRLEAQVGAAQAASGPGVPTSPEPFQVLNALSLLSEALRDPDIRVRAVRVRSPQPNAHQKLEFARAYLEADRAEEALTWLEGDWGSMDGSQKALQAHALAKLGRVDESASIRKEMFEQSLSVFDWHQWLEQLPAPAHGEARAHARQLALGHDDPVTAALLLLELGDPDAAEGKLVDRPAGIDGNNYPTLVPLAKALRANSCWRGETIVYRALLRGILSRAYARAYGHAARYLMRLREIARSDVDLTPLPPHETIEAELAFRHGRKVAFWSHVNGERDDRPYDEEDDE